MKITLLEILRKELVGKYVKNIHSKNRLIEKARIVKVLSIEDKLDYEGETRTEINVIVEYLGFKIKRIRRIETPITIYEDVEFFSEGDKDFESFELELYRLELEAKGFR